METADYISIAILTMFVLCAGMASFRRGAGSRGFFSAEGTLPWWMSGLSLFMGFFSAGTFVVWGSIAYTSGWVAVVIQWTMSLAGVITGIFIAPRWHKTAVLTPAGYISGRFGVRTQKFYTILFLLLSLFNSGVFLYPVGVVLHVSTGLSLPSCIILVCIVSITYVTIGGLKAVAVTDVLQFLILMTGVAVTVPLALARTGGLHSWVAALPEHFFSATSGEWTPLFLLSFAVYNTVLLGGNWGFVQRFTSVKTPSDARKASFLFSALYFVCPVLWMLPPMIYRAIDPSLNGLADENAYLMICKAVLPAGLLGLMLLGIVCATMSSLNSILNVTSAVITDEVYRRLKPASSERELMTVARLTIIMAGLLSMCIALSIPHLGGVVNVVVSIAALTGAPLYLPVIWSLFSRCQTSFSLMSVTLSSMAVNVFFKFVLPSLSGHHLSRGMEMFIGVSVPVLLLAVWEVWCRIRTSVKNN
ncbi:MAG: sodium transporter [Parabacteroides sp.]|nr:sodium transporter [Parabacteroides sp.]